MAAAKNKGASEKLVEEAESAILDFTNLVQELGGSRSAFNTIISGLLPDVRGRIERRNKKAAFDAFSNLLGYQVDTSFVTCIIQPSKNDEEVCDSVCFTGKTGLKHLTPRVSRIIWAQKCCLNPDDAPQSSCDLDMKPVTREGDVPLLKEFCTKPIPKFRLFRHGDSAYIALEGDDHPTIEPMNIFIGSFTPGPFLRYKCESLSNEYISITPSEPAKVVFLDVLMRDDVWIDTQPELKIYRTGPRGNLAYPGERPFDKIDLLESVTYLGQGTNRMHTNDVENYASMVRSVFDRINWPQERFRGFRVRVEFPILHSQIMMSFPLPEKK